MLLLTKGLIASVRFLGRIFLISIFVLSFYFQSAGAKPGASALPDPASRQSNRTDSQGRNITVIDFEDARIEGNAKAPDGFFLRSRSASKADNILNLRKNFHRRVRSVGHEGLRAVPMN